ncbi:NifU family protein [Nodularia spumigena CS-584]|jgi:Fe-S cluster biogenesis protein NfuA/nitrite reductase/ring-hydroxylating ferredoxin subunit|uniref:NifU family protein n=1 Tax=Nodularia spumigena UHCC 0060 TaxID=3110300 RepID=A0ABU5UN09_NODSP|nr:NifU family protein [Nodularia spumigena]AHJ30415.1 NifU protein, putative [Nodularia spumigena CCY9414]EAW46972.1 Nitrogen-fixing NifU-like protein [Nodularia spumigena CCY9414]MDB9383434.1 NifU family protein [Nodularia spumigena CS-584]MEA5524355.1 NifU family protein [Nodularia spumigena UHCC 0143]MEA5607671.1 NifU family protein [Nodularia spumigena UHCC 0060]
MTKLEELIQEINRFEAIISQWEESQRCVAVGLKRAIEDLHKAALTHLIKSLKQESMSALRQAVDDDIVYSVLLYHELIKPPQAPLIERINTALEEVRPGLKSHDGDVEFVAIKPPDTVEVKLIGSCSSCPTSTLTLTQSVEQAIKNHCPEITKVVAVNHTSTVNSPFTPEDTATWVKLTTIDQIPESGILTGKVGKNSLILYRQGENITCYLNACPHLATPLDMGKLDNGILTCKSHGFQYNLETGECLTVADVPLQSYPVQIKGEKVFVKLPKYSI